MITKTCSVSGKEFIITDDDLKFYEKMGVPIPTLCPEERQRRRLTWRNERKLYKRKCDATGEVIVSIYSPEYLGKVYSTKAYWGDSWNGLDYGKGFDFDRSFFEQWKALFLETPQLPLILKEAENSDYANDALRIKNCYLVFDGEQARDCFYGETFVQTQDCLDFLFLEFSELCYECVNCTNAYRLLYSYNCKNCSESYFLKDCIGCKNCIGCVNLRNKQYWINNKPHTKEQYEKKVKQFSFGSHNFMQSAVDSAYHFWSSDCVKYISGVQNENVTGDHIRESKDCFECYDCAGIRDCKYCTNVLVGGNDCYDISIWGNSMNWCYNSVGVGEGVQNVVGSLYVCFGAENMYYSAYCWNNCKDCFGCVGLQKAQYCILNKQYSKEEYFALKEKIIEHMKQTGEWGEFFPSSLSPFAYNETVANEYFPLTKEEAIEKGYTWREEEVLRGVQDTHDTYSIPDHIKEVSDDILGRVLVCEETRKPYRIIKPELDFYRKMGLPIPRLHPDERHKRRMELRNPRKLWDRKCAECQKNIQTTYHPSRPEKILCEECYLKVVE